MDIPKTHEEKWNRSWNGEEKGTVEGREQLDIRIETRNIQIVDAIC
jgi:hypothetical protein